MSQSFTDCLRQLLPSVELVLSSQVLPDQDLKANCALNLAMLDDDLDTGVTDTKAIVSVCQQYQIPLIHLSSYQVFSGDKKNVHNEKDVPSNSQNNLWFSAEAIVSAAIEKHIILRTSWLISSRGKNLLSRLLAAFLNGEKIQVHRRLRGAPTAIDDFARVTIAIIKQIQTGADNWGVMHYCSSDHCNEEEFAEQVLQYLIQYQLLTAEPSLQLVDSEEESLSGAILGCRRLRDGFGIQARSWRPNLLAMIKEWLADKQLVKNSATKKSKGKN